MRSLFVADGRLPPRAMLAIIATAALVACHGRPAEEARDPAKKTAARAIAFVDVTVVPLDAPRELPHTTVVVRGDRIVAIGPTATTALPEGAERIDGKGKYLMPGLADMHVHITREADLALFVARGVTTVRNMWGAPMHLALRDRVRRGELLGPTITTAGPILDGDPPVHPGSFVVRSAADAVEAIRLHRTMGYDFVKVYSRLGESALEAIAHASKDAGLAIVGHVARDAGLARAVDLGQAGIEHVNSFYEALQADSSPVKGKFDGDAFDRKPMFVDDAKLAPLARSLREHDVSVCPTINLANQLAPAPALRERLERAEMKYVMPCDLAIWRSEASEPSSAELREREVAVGKKIVRALHDGGVRLLAGTDTGNPLVVPGFTTHEELAMLVDAGLTPYDALRAATHNAAEVMSAVNEFGVVAVGARADLLLVDGDPLANVGGADRITGVMLRGRYLDEKARAELLAKHPALSPQADPFAGVPPLASAGPGARREGEPMQYAITWKGVSFGAERMMIEVMPDGARVVSAQAIDPHRGQWMTVHLRPQHVILESDGANGRGRVEISRSGKTAMVRGTLLAGNAIARQIETSAEAALGARQFLASKMLLVPRLKDLAVGASIQLALTEIALESDVAMPSRTLDILRRPDKDGLWRFEITEAFKRTRGGPDVLTIDPATGTIVDYDITSFEVRFARQR